MRYFTATSIWKSLAVGCLVLAVLAGCSKAPSSTNTKKKPSQQTKQKSSPKKKTPATPTPKKKPPETTSRMPKFFEGTNKPKPTKPLPVFRTSDNRSKHDAQKLKAHGIHLYASKRLLLYTDIDPNIAKTLPPFVDALYIALEDYFGKLPPDREQTNFQMTGYIMKDKQLFKRLGLHPDDLRPFLNGRHRGAEFWMYEQEYDYYRRHLMLHEATHCFMTITPDVNVPVWYLEGMAELFGTHRIDKQKKVIFRTMPHTKEEVAGLGRITIMREDYLKGKGMSVSAVMNLQAVEFLKTNAYAWSWGLCKFFDSHPQYAKRFQKLGRYTTGSQFSRVFQQSFQNDFQHIFSEWTCFAGNLQYSYDCKQAAIHFEKGVPLQKNNSQQCSVVSNKGWQSTKVFVEKGKAYHFSATGKFVLAEQPKPWVSEANGISFRYIKGKPIGQLLAAIHIEKPTTGLEQASLLQVYSIGSDKTWTAPTTGTLYLRLNDAWSELADNKGAVDVSIRQAEPE